jgi:hypothetical protein
MSSMTLVDQTVLRAPGGLRWVVQTLRTGDGYTTTARKTGCDLTPAGTRASTTAEAARRTHEAFRRSIEERGALP